MFYSPFDACAVCKQYVLLDQTRTECAREHGCHIEKCPLERYFAEAREGRAGAADEGLKQQSHGGSHD